MAGQNGKGSDAAPQGNGIWEPVTEDGEAVRLLQRPRYTVRFVTFTRGICNHTTQIAPFKIDFWLGNPVTYKEHNK